ncbi:MAG: nucleotidyltransferase [Luteitalea sp.]|nr:nucleotidyltransferase [Luteitalea sp.]
MATTVAQAFLDFKANLEITGLQKQTVSTRQAHVREVLEAGLEVEDSFLTGSSSRSTMIAPLNEADVDVLVVLPASYFHHYREQGTNGGPAGLLDLVKRTLRRTYTRTPDIGRNGQAVTIRFSGFVVDVVPGVRRQGGGFLIPNSITQKWLSTDPRTHVQLMVDANAAHGGSLVPMIKMLKGWNRASGGILRSFHLEVLALSILSNVRISDFPSGVRYVFDKGRALVTQRNPDPAGYGDDVGQYLNTQDKIQAAVAKFQVAYERAIRAEDHGRRGTLRDAIEAWRRVFGDYFPAYG